MNRVISIIMCWFSQNSAYAGGLTDYHWNFVGSRTSNYHTCLLSSSSSHVVLWGFYYSHHCHTFCTLYEPVTLVKLDYLELSLCFWSPDFQARPGARWPNYIFFCYFGHFYSPTCSAVCYSLDFLHERSRSMQSFSIFRRSVASVRF